MSTPSDTDALTGWVAVQRMLDVFKGSRRGWNCPVEIMQTVDAVFRPTTPYEVISEYRPVPVAEDEGLAPFDDVLGRYTAEDRTVTVFRRNVEHYARSAFDCDPEDLENIVRLHEYAHAIIHEGVDRHADRQSFAAHPPRSAEDCVLALATALARYKTIDVETHEFAAQLITWATLTSSSHPDSSRLRVLFRAAMPKQPKRYRLPDRLLAVAIPTRNVRLVLDLFHNTLQPLPEGVELRAAVEELALSGMP